MSSIMEKCGACNPILHAGPVLYLILEHKCLSQYARHLQKTYLNPFICVAQAGVGFDDVCATVVTARKFDAYWLVHIDLSGKYICRATAYYSKAGWRATVHTSYSSSWAPFSELALACALFSVSVLMARRCRPSLCTPLAVRQTSV